MYTLGLMHMFSWWWLWNNQHLLQLAVKTGPILIECEFNSIVIVSYVQLNYFSHSHVVWASLVQYIFEFLQSFLILYPITNSVFKGYFWFWKQVVWGNLCITYMEYTLLILPRAMCWSICLVFYPEVYFKNNWNNFLHYWKSWYICNCRCWCKGVFIQYK